MFKLMIILGALVAVTLAYNIEENFQNFAPIDEESNAQHLLAKRELEGLEENLSPLDDSEQARLKRSLLVRASYVPSLYRYDLPYAAYKPIYRSAFTYGVPITSGHVAYKI